MTIPSSLPSVKVCAGQ